MFLLTFWEGDMQRKSRIYTSFKKHTIRKTKQRSIKFEAISCFLNAVVYVQHYKVLLNDNKKI